MPTIEEAIQAIRMGDPDSGRQILEDLLEEDETNEQVWLWLATVVDSDEEREICLDNVLALNPNNTIAKKGLNAVRAGSFNVYSILDEILEVEHPDVPETTFIDDFMITNDSALGDDELRMPSTMGGAGARKKSAGKSKFNVRVILLVLFVLLIVVVLAGLAAVNMFFGGSTENGAPTGQPTPEQVQPGQSAPEPTATDTPLPVATDTPTPTKTPFQLPTPKPTDSPSPTATKVVPPTPG